MKLRLQLVRDGEVLFEIPLSPTDWPREQLEDELDAFETDFRRFSKIFDALSHETRFRMMKLLMEEEDRTINFTDFMRDLNLNPKIVWENAKKLREGGVLRKGRQGKIPLFRSWAEKIHTDKLRLEASDRSSGRNGKLLGR